MIGKINKFGSSQIGIGIIVMAALLLMGGIFFDDNGNSKSNYLSSKNNNGEEESEIGEEFLFYLEEIELGRQKKVTENYPNIELGSKEEYNTIFIGNNFRISANASSPSFISWEEDIIINWERPVSGACEQPKKPRVITSNKLRIILFILNH